MKDPGRPYDNIDEGIRLNIQRLETELQKMRQQTLTTHRYVSVANDVVEPVEGQIAIEDTTLKWYADNAWHESGGTGGTRGRVNHSLGAVRGPGVFMGNLSTEWPGGVIAINARDFYTNGSLVTRTESWSRNDQVISCSTVGSNYGNSQQIALLDSDALTDIGIVYGRPYTIHVTLRATTGVTGGMIYFKGTTWPSFVIQDGNDLRIPHAYVHANHIQNWFSFEEVNQYLQFSGGESMHWYYTSGDELEIRAHVTGGGSVELDQIIFVPMAVYVDEADPIGLWGNINNVAFPADPNVDNDWDHTDGEGNGNYSWTKHNQKLPRGILDSNFKLTCEGISHFDPQGHDEWWTTQKSYDHRQDNWHLYLGLGVHDPTNEAGIGFATLFQGAYTPVSQVTVSRRSRGLYYLGPFRPWDNLYHLGLWEPEVDPDWDFPWDYFYGDSSGGILASVPMFVRDDQTSY